jgi:hypothetical protein
VSIGPFSMDGDDVARPDPQADEVGGQPLARRSSAA